MATHAIYTCTHICTHMLINMYIYTHMYKNMYPHACLHLYMSIWLIWPTCVYRQIRPYLCFKIFTSVRYFLMTPKKIYQWLIGTMGSCKDFWVCARQPRLRPSDPYIEGILPKGPYLPCVSMAGRALLAGYHWYASIIWVITGSGTGLAPSCPPQSVMTFCLLET